MGINLEGLFVILLLFAGLGLGIFFLIKHLLIKFFRFFPEKRITMLSALSVAVFIAITGVALVRLMMAYPPAARMSSKEYYKSLDEEYYNVLRKGMTKREVADLIGESDTTKNNVVVYDFSIPNATDKYVLTIEFDSNKVVSYSKNAKVEDVE
jgi:hypothetical protein